MRRNTKLLICLFSLTVLVWGCSKTKDSSSESGLNDNNYMIENNYSSDSDNESETRSSDGSNVTSETYSHEAYEESNSLDYSDNDSSGNEDWDEVLNAYEQFADGYIVFLRKVQKGDASALSSYTDYLSKATSFADKLNSASSSMTAAQISKFNKIQQKIIKAASNVKVDMSQLNIATGGMEAVDEVLSSFADDNDDDNDTDVDDDDDDW